ncbi:hypothetical protein IscW_ISCW004402, partial [Ixodes scapularis]
SWNVVNFYYGQTVCFIDVSKSDVITLGESHATFTDITFLPPLKPPYMSLRSSLLGLTTKLVRLVAVRCFPGPASSSKRCCCGRRRGRSVALILLSSCRRLGGRSVVLSVLSIIGLRYLEELLWVWNRAGALTRELSGVEPRSRRFRPG